MTVEELAITAIAIGATVFAVFWLGLKEYERIFREALDA